MTDITMMETEALIREYYANKRQAEQMEYLLTIGPDQLRARLELTKKIMDKMQSELRRRGEEV